MHSLKSPLNYQNIIHIFILLFMIFTFSLVAWLPVQPVDEYFYLKAGLDWINQGLSPWIDHYSFTHYGEVIHGVPYIYEVIIALSVKTFGIINGFKFFLLANFLLLTIAICFYYKSFNANWISLLLVLPILLFFLLIRTNPRPELFSNFLIVLSLIWSLRLKNNFIAKDLALVALLLLFWSNWHTPVFGYLIFFAVFVDKAVDKLLKKDQNFTWNFWLLWGSIVFFVGFINPDFSHFFFDTLKFMQFGWTTLVGEFAETKATIDNNIQLNLLWISALIVSLYHFYKKQFGSVFIILLLVYFSLKISRLQVPAAIIILLQLLYVLNQLSVKKYISNLTPSIKYFLIASIAGLYLYNAYLLSTIVRSLLLIQFNETITTQFKTRFKNSFVPQEEIDYLKKYKKGGNIFNSFVIGSIIPYYLSPDYKVFWDGRLNILYSYDFAKKYTDLGANHANVFINEAKQYAIDYVVLKNSSLNYVILSKNKNFKLEYISEKFFLFSKQKLNEHLGYHKTAKLSLFPQCWNKEINKIVASEINSKPDILLAQQSRMARTQNIVKNYIASKNTNHFFLNLKNLKLNSELRLAAYIAIKNNEFDKAIEYFNNLKGHTHKDRLFLIYSFAKATRFKDAKQLIKVLASKELSKLIGLKPLKNFELQTLYTLYKNYQDDLSLEAKTIQELEKLKKQLLFLNPKIKFAIEDIFPVEECHELFF